MRRRLKYEMRSTMDKTVQCIDLQMHRGETIIFPPIVYKRTRTNSKHVENLRCRTYNFKARGLRCKIWLEVQ